MAVTIEYLTLQDLSPQLRIGFKKNIETLADSFRTRGLIDDKCHDIVTSTRSYLTESEKANEILKGVTDSVKLSTKFYHSMIEALNQSPAYSLLVEMLNDEYKKKGGAIVIGGTTQTLATPVSQGGSSIWHDEIKIHLLNLIRYRDPRNNQKELRLLSEMAPNWREIGEIVTLNPAVIRAVQNPGAGTTPDQCIRGVISKWLENAPNMARSDRYPNSWLGLYNLLTDSLSGAAAENLKKAIEARHSDFHRNLDSAPVQQQLQPQAPVQQQFQPQAPVQQQQVPAGGGVVHQQHQVQAQQQPAAPPGKRRKKNKNQLAEWLEEEMGVDEADVKLLKDRGVNEMLFQNMKRGDEFLKDVSQATLMQLEMLKTELKNS